MPEDDTTVPFSNADPSWYPMVLRTLARDYPKISEDVWGTTISENAARLTARRAAEGNEGTGPDVE